MPRGTLPSIPDDIGAQLLQGFGALSEGIERHEKQDEERHKETGAKLDRLGLRIERLEANATETGQHRAVQLALDSKKKEHWGLWEKLLTAGVGAILAGVGAVLTHFLGLK